MWFSRLLGREYFTSDDLSQSDGFLGNLQVSDGSDYATTLRGRLTAYLGRTDPTINGYVYAYYAIYLAAEGTLLNESVISLDNMTDDDKPLSTQALNEAQEGYCSSGNNNEAIKAINSAANNTTTTNPTGAGGGTGGSVGEGADNGGTGFGGEGSSSGGGSAGSDGAAIRRNSGFTVNVSNSGTLSGSTTATSVL